MGRAHEKGILYVYLFQAEIVPLNMEIRIPSIKEVFPEESVKETGFARDMREVEEALVVEE